MWNLVAQYLLVYRDQNESFQLRLRHQEPVERVAMQGWKPSGPLCLRNGDR